MMDLELEEMLHRIETVRRTNRQPPLITLGPIPEHLEQLTVFQQDMVDMREAWEAYDKAMLLSDNDTRQADKAFAAVRKAQRTGKVRKLAR